MKKKLLAILFTYALTTALFTGCGSSYEKAATTEMAVNDAFYDDYDEGFSYAEAYEEETYSGSGSSSGTSSDNSITENNISSSRKIIYTSSLNIETKDFDGAQKTLYVLINSKNGYIESSDISGNASNSYRYGSFQVRIPVKNYSEFMESCGGIGSITNKSENANDVTSQYVDVNAHISSLKTKLKRLEELEQNADNLTDLLAIEDRINDAQYQLDNYNGQLKALEDKIDYCTITIRLETVQEYTPVEEESFITRAVDAFKTGIEAFVNVLQGILIALIYLLPFILLAIVVIVIVRKILKKKKISKENIEKAKEKE